MQTENVYQLCAQLLSNKTCACWMQLM